MKPDVTVVKVDDKITVYEAMSKIKMPLSAIF